MHWHDTRAVDIEYTKHMYYASEFLDPKTSIDPEGFVKVLTGKEKGELWGVHIVSGLASNVLNAMAEYISDLQANMSVVMGIGKKQIPKETMRTIVKDSYQEVYGGAK